jgi:hypothetical protein
MLPPRSAEARCRSWTTLLTSTVTAKHGRQLLRQIGKRQMLKHVLPLERLDVEEPKRSCSLRHRFRRQLSFPQQVQLILTYLLRAKLVGSMIASA